MQKVFFKLMVMFLVTSNLWALDPANFIYNMELFEKDNHGKLVPRKENREKMKYDIEKGIYKLRNNSYKLTVNKHKNNSSQYSRITEWHLTPRRWYTKLTDPSDKNVVGRTSLFDTEGNLVITTECNIFEGSLYFSSRGCGSATIKRCEMALKLKSRIDEIKSVRQSCSNVFKDLENFINDKTDIELIKDSYDQLDTGQSLPGKVKTSLKEDGRRGSFFDTMDVNIKMLSETIFLCDKYSKFFKSNPTP